VPILDGSDIVCVGFADWRTELWTNQHHLMSRLARTNRVLFVESLGLRRPTLSGRDVGRMLRRLRTGLGPTRFLDGVNVLSPLVLPAHSATAVRRLNAWLLRRRVAAVARGLGLRSPVLWAYVPQAEVLVDVLAPSLVVYHVVDDIAAHGRIDAAAFAEAERRLLARADLVLASSPALVARLEELGASPMYLPNVADTELFAQALADGPVDAALAPLPRPRAVFVGAVSAVKLDVALLSRLARLRPGWSFALVGPVGLGDPGTDVSELAALPNVHLLGPRRPDELPAVFRGSDVALIPYAENRLTASIFPMKVYEYLAAGLPVLATHLPSLADVPDVVLADDAEAAAAALDALAADDAPGRRRERSERAAPHNWDARLDELRAAVAALS